MHIEAEGLFPLLERYLAGETSARDAEIVREWLAEDAAHAQILADLRLIKHVTHDTPPPTSVDAAWTQAVKTLGLRRKPRVLRRLLMVALAPAAGLLPGVGGGRGGRGGRPGGGKGTPARPPPVHPLHGRAPGGHT